MKISDLQFGFNEKSAGTTKLQKQTVVELTDRELMQVDGGTTPVCLVATIISVVTMTMSGCNNQN